MQSVLGHESISDELEQAIQRAASFLGYPPDDIPDTEPYEQFFHLGTILRDSWLENRLTPALEESIRLHRRAVSLCPPAATGRDDVLFWLAYVLMDLYENRGEIVDLQEGIKLLQETLQLRPFGHQNRPVSLNNLATALNHRYKRLGEVADLDEYIHLNQEALSLCPEGNPDRHWSLNDLAAALSDRYARLGVIADLDECIRLHEEALSLRPEGDPYRPSSLNNLGTSLNDRYSRLGVVADLDRSICLHEEALSLRPVGNPHRPSSLNNLGTALNDRYSLLGVAADVDECIRLHAEALSLRPVGNPNRHVSLNNLAAALRYRYTHLGAVADLDKSIRLHKEALSLRPVGHSDRPSSLNNLANALDDQYARLGMVADLEECINLNREALSLRPEGNPDRHWSLSNLAIALRRRYACLGLVADLDDSIRLHEQVLSLRPVGHPDRRRSLNDLAAALNDRYARLGEDADLDECIRLHEEVLNLSPEGNSDRHWSLNNLAIALSYRYARLGEFADLEKRIRLNEEALGLRPEGNPNRPSSLNDLAAALSDRYVRLGVVADLDECIHLHEEALSLRPKGNPYLPSTLNDLANALSHRYARLGNVADLDESIRLLEEALRLRPVGNSDRHWSLNDLAGAFSYRFSLFGNSIDLDASISLLRSGSKDTLSPQASVLQCALHWITVAEKHHHASIKEAFTTAIVCLRQYLSTGPTIKLQYDALLRKTRIASLPVDAAAYLIEEGNVEQAVELLDEGRGLLVSEMRRFRETLSPSDQEKIGEQLSSRYLALCKDLRSLSNVAVRFETYSLASSKATSDESAASSSVAYGQVLKDKREKLEEYNNLLMEIRNLPGCADFQRRPKFKDLQAAASEGPVIIINCSNRRSDVIIIFADQKPQLIPLGKGFRSKINEVHQLYLEGFSSAAEAYRSTNTVCVLSATLKRVASALWVLVVSMIVEKLEEAGIPKESRIWWCPTSLLTALPLHAAGRGKDYFLDHFVPSYTPTLSALIDARRTVTESESDGKPSSPRILVAAQTKSSGLKYAKAEAERMAGLGSFVHCLDEEEATPASVIARLPSFNWAHFICHGTVSKDPFESSLILYGKSRLNLGEIIKAHLPDARFAFLAACHTAELSRGEALQDEVLHLVAAMQFSGFRSVVGTMWQMEDKDGPRLAEVFYGEMLAGDEEAGERHTRAACALWKAVQMMRKRNIHMARWANFVHIGA